jgi:hypothetical protein
VTLLDFTENDFLTSGEVLVVKHLQAFRSGYRVVTEGAVLTFHQYRRIFTSRFRQVYSRTALRKEDSAEEADALLALLIGLLLAADRPAHILSILMSRAPARVTELKASPLLLRHAAAVACQFLMMGPVTVDVVAAILGGKDCFDSYNARLRNGFFEHVPV